MEAHKLIAVALLTAVVATGCTVLADIQPLGHDTYRISRSGPATGVGYSPLTQDVDSRAKQYRASRHEHMSVINTTDDSQITAGGVFAGEVFGYLEVDVIFRCPPATGVP
jgi:hypothetical protein